MRLTCFTKNEGTSFIKKKIKNPFFHEFVKNYSLYIMTIPGLVFVFLLCYLPMVGILVGFKDYRNYANNFFINIIKSKWVGFKYFRRFLHDPDFMYSLRNTVLYQLSFILLGLVISVLIALLLNEIRNRYLSKIYQSIMLLPFFLSWVVLSYVVFAFLSVENGFLNKTVFQYLGIEPIKWYMEPGYWPFILFFANTLKYTGYASIIYLAAIVGIDPEYYEAAIIDGANRLQLATKVTIPLISHVIIILLILNLGNILAADFGLFFNIPLESEFVLKTTSVVDMYIYRSLRGAQAGGDMMVSTAAGFFKSLVGLTLVSATNFIVKKIDSQKALF